MISKNHSNRKAYNWLIYDIGDRFLQKYIPYYKGVLYDLGCGESPFREFFLCHADKYIGVDWAGSYHDTNADVAADLNKPLPLESDIADTVVSISVMEHLCEPQVMLNEAYRILKPGGFIILHVPFMWQVHEAPYDFYRYTCYGLRYMFGKAGFSEIEVNSASGFWSMWTLKFNYQSTRLIRGTWVVRKLVTLILKLIWALDQRIASWADKHWQCDDEAAGYYVVAKKL